jgi:hypothetical protein
MNFEIGPQHTASGEKAVLGHEATALGQQASEAKEHDKTEFPRCGDPKRGFKDDGKSRFGMPLSAAELERAGPGETEWLWHGYLAPGCVTLLTSLWKSGKSTLVAVLLAKMKMRADTSGVSGTQYEVQSTKYGVASTECNVAAKSSKCHFAATSNTLAGLALGAGRAVVISEEPASLWAQRNQLLGFGPHVSWYCQPFLGQPRMEDWERLLDEIGRTHEQQKIDLLVIDSLAKLAPLSRENDAGEMLKALKALERLARAGMSVLILHHPRKGKYRPGQAARGSGALLAFVDVFIEMERVSRRNSKDRRRRLRAFSRYRETPAKWVIELAEDGSDYVSLGASAEPELEKCWPVMKSILERAEDRLTWRQLVQRWPENFPRPCRTTMRRWLEMLLQDRQILREGRGTRNNPFVYLLPGMEIKWQDEMLRGLVGGFSYEKGS